MRHSVTKSAGWLLGMVLASCGASAPSPAQIAEADRRVEKGREAFLARDYAAAEKWFAQALELDPERARAHYFLGVSHYERSLGFLGMPAVDRAQLDPAREAFDRAIELDPSESAFHLYAGLARFRDHRPAEAIPFFREAVRLAPDDLEPRFRLGVSLQVDDRPAEALAELEQVVTRKPDHPKAWHHMGLACQELERWQDAVFALQQAVRLTPEDASPWFDLAESLRRTGRDEEAAQAEARFRELHDASQDVANEAIRDAMRREGDR